MKTSLDGLGLKVRGCDLTRIKLLARFEPLFCCVQAVELSRLQLAFEEEFY